jgi:hypothetical protein
MQIPVLMRSPNRDIRYFHWWYGRRGAYRLEIIEAQVKVAHYLRDSSHLPVVFF